MFPTVVLEKTLQSPLDSKEIKPVNPKGSQPWLFIGRTEAEAVILQPPDVKSQLISHCKESPDAGKELGQEEKGVAEDEMVRWHHQINGHEFEQILEDSEEHGMLQSMGSQRDRHNLETEQDRNKDVNLEVLVTL